MEEYVNLECADLCKKSFGAKFTDIYPLKASGSARRYFRVKINERPYIICYSKNIQENHTFIKLSEYLINKNIPVPRIYGVSGNYEMYILQDLGDIDFMSVLKEKNNFPDLRKKLNPILKDLVVFQTLPQNEWKDIVEFPPLDEELIRYDFNYCTSNFFEACGIGYDEKMLSDEFRKLENILLEYPRNLWGLMFRDFQSRNIMLHEDKPFFIDYQSSRFGPGVYDFVSFAWQAKAGFSMKERNDIIDMYCKAWEERGLFGAEIIKENVGYWALFRIIQTLGAYGLRGLKEGKTHFIESIPFAIGNLKELFNNYRLTESFPVLYDIIEKASKKYHI